MSPALFALFSISFQDRPTPKVPEAIVIVQGKALSLPPLPQDFVEARRRNREVQAEIASGVETIKGLIQEISDRAAALPSGKSPIPKEQEAQARLLLEHLRDPLIREKESALLAALKAWEDDRRWADSETRSTQLRKGGKAEPPSSNPLGTKPGSFDPKLSAGNGLPGLAAWEANKEALRLDAFEAEQASRQRATLSQSRTTLALAEHHGPLVRKAWEGIGACLHESSRQVGEWETALGTSKASAILALLRRVKLQLLQRYLTHLELCSAIWTGFAS